MNDFRLIMISAMYENGGNTTHRMMDGHPELYVYPFESQLGTGFANDYLASLVPIRYRWPEFPMHAGVEQDYESFWDEELKARCRSRASSKFRNQDLDLSEAERKQAFAGFMTGKPRTRANLVEAYFRSCFQAWKNYRHTGKEKAYVGYNPVQVLDTDKIFKDFPTGHVLHVVRNPFSAFADTCKRPFPLSLERYAHTWGYIQYLALTYQHKHPKNFHILRFEDLIADPARAWADLCPKLGIAFAESLLVPSFNGVKLEEVAPWGTIRIPTPKVNRDTANELTPQQKEEIKALTSVSFKLLGYDDQF